MRYFYVNFCLFRPYGHFTLCQVSRRYISVMPCIHVCVIPSVALVYSKLCNSATSKFSRHVFSFPLCPIQRFHLAGGGKCFAVLASSVNFIRPLSRRFPILKPSSCTRPNVFVFTPIPSSIPGSCAAVPASKSADDASPLRIPLICQIAFHHSVRIRMFITLCHVSGLR